MKICKIYIKGFQQFQDVELDFTHPETGEPLNKICFIGSNGTGKSKLLMLIKKVFRIGFFNMPNRQFIDFERYFSENPSMKLLLKIKFENNIYFFYCFQDSRLLIRGSNNLLRDEALSSEILQQETHHSFSSGKWVLLREGTLATSFLEKFLFAPNNKDLLIYSPAESVSNGYSKIADVPVTNVSEAIGLFKEYPFYAEVSQDTLNSFWKLLVFNLRKRAEERDEYENRAENIKKTKEKLIEEFDKLQPKIIEELSIIWDKILNKTGLYFDVAGASNPYQLNDNLKVYIKLKSNDKIIPYSDLSTGIRNFIFRLGHIFSLYFNREIDRAILLIDEPENSLYPDFLFDLVETYTEVIVDKRGQNNTQMFFATHNPIIAAQFQPYERIILDWNEDGSVSPRKGVSPVGDDPNDILTNDFELTRLMGAEGQKQLEKYVTLKIKLNDAKTKEEKFQIASEINKIGELYNFEE